ncbi:MAG: RNA polymerase sigma factor [Bacteroidia bacterium]|nr:RNA polymerase sigma factor [Bacteroidia bacterium]
MDDTELIQKLKSGDSAAFGILIKEYRKKVINTCFGFLKNTLDAEDAAQEVFLEVWYSVSGFRQDSSLGVWIYRIAVNKSLDQLRKMKRKKRMSMFKEMVGFTSNPEALSFPADSDPYSETEQNETTRILLNAIEKLPVSQKVAFTLHKYENISYVDIAKVMDITVPAVESLIHRAKMNLKKTLSLYYYGKV